MKKIFVILSLLLVSLLFVNFNTVGAATTGPNGKEAPTVQYNDVATYNVSYYDDIKGMKGDNLLEGLAEISQTNHRYFNTYTELWGGNCYSDVDSNDPDNKIIDFYTQQSISNTYCTSNMSGYNADINWNREHVWCKSLSGGLYTSVSTSDRNAGTDIHHLRPNIANINSSRNNSLYGDVDDSYARYHNTTEGVAATSSTGTLYGYLDKSACTNGAFEPIDSVKGDVARILMYMYMHYSTEVSANSDYSYSGSLSITNIVYTSSNSDSAAWNLLLSWNELDPVDTFEANRNDYCASVTGLRNPFIDHSEFATMIWDDSYSGEGAIIDKVENSGGSEGGEVTPEEPETPVVPEVPVTEPELVETTITDLVNNAPTTEKDKIYVVTGTWTNKDGYTSSTNTYGNGTLNDDNSSITIYGLSGNKDNCLSFSNGVYTYTNSQDFTSLNIEDGTKVKVGMIYTSYYKNYSAYLIEIIEEEEPVVINPLYYLINNYHNSGVYTKKSNIYLNGDAESEIKRYFHGNVDKDRTTYYNGDYLLMANYDGTFASLDSNNNPIDGINSGYYTSGVDMRHFVYNNGIIDTYTVKNTSLHEFFVTLNKMNTTTYFDSTWVDGIHEVSGKDDKYLADFLAFAAPCLTDLVLTSNYLTSNGMKLEVVEGSNEFGNYLAFKLYVSSDNTGAVINGELLSEARVYKGNTVFDETPEEPETPSIKEAETYNYTFTSKVFEGNDTKQLGLYSWSLTGNGNYYSYDSTKGHQLGSGNAPFTNMTLTSVEQFNNIREIQINTSGANNIAATLNIKVGDTVIDTITLTNSATTYVVTLDEYLTGNISFVYTQTSSKALYIKSIEITSDARDAVNLEFANISNGSVTADKDSYKVEDTVVLTITPDAGYQLKALYLNGEAVGTTSLITSYTFVIKNDTLVSAEFEKSSSEPSSEVTELAVFNLGENGTASHYDGTEKTSYSETSGNYTLELSGLSKVYGGARDATGNSCLKLGTGSLTGSFSFTVSDNVTEVVIYVAQYKANTTSVSINGVQYSITTPSNSGSYTEIKIDTTKTKTITFTTNTDGMRCMIDRIVYNGLA